MTRCVKHHDTVPLSFADGYPYLLTNKVLLRDLQQRCPASVKMEQFRSNLVASSASAWEEDHWKVIRIGDAVFNVAKPCNHYTFTAASPEKGQKHPAGEPLKTLQSSHTAQGNGDVDFGQNLVTRDSGVIRAGNGVETLAMAPTKTCGVAAASDTTNITQQPGANIDIDQQGQTFRGDNQQVLLEQLENQGIRIPYPCHMGTCGSYRAQLLEGEVTPLKKSTAGDDGTTFCYSYVPETALKLAR